MERASPNLRACSALLGYIRKAASAARADRQQELNSIALALSSRKRYRDIFAEGESLATLVSEGGPERLLQLGESLAKKMEQVRRTEAKLKQQDWAASHRRR